MRAKMSIVVALVAVMALAASAFAHDRHRGGSSGGGGAVPRTAPPSGHPSHPAPATPRSPGAVGSPHQGAPAPRQIDPPAGETRRTGRTRGGRPIVGTAVPRSTVPGSGLPASTIYYYFPSYAFGLYPYGSFGLGYFLYDPFYSSWGDPYGYYSGYGYSQSGYGYSGSSGSDHGAIRLKVKPRKAQVFVDGSYYGIVDEFDGFLQKLRLEEGPHHIEIRAEGYQSLAFDVRIQGGRTITYEGHLTPLEPGSPR